MIPTSVGFSAAVRASRRRGTRLVLLTSLLATTEAWTGEDGLVLEGSVTIDRTREQRRTMSLTLANERGLWTPTGPASPFYLNRIVQLQRALYVTGQPEWVPLGTFLIDEPEITVAAGSSVIRLAGTDRTKLAATSAFTEPYTIPLGTRLRDAVRIIAQQAGMGADDRLYDLADAGRVLGAPVTYDEGENRLAAMMRLAQDHALDLFPSAFGILTMAPLIALEDQAADWTFQRGSEAIMLGITKRFSDATLFNHTVVVGEGVDFGPYRGEARDLNPASPVYNPPDGSGPIGDRLAPIYRSAGITSIAQAQEVAQALLRDVALVEEQVAVPSVTHPALEAGDVVRITEATSATDDTYLLDSVTQPIGAGIMQLATKKLRALVA